MNLASLLPQLLHSHSVFSPSLPLSLSLSVSPPSNSPLTVPSSKSVASFYFRTDLVDKTVERSLTLCSSALVNDDGVQYL